jgi:hypothetical protein
MRYEYRTHGDFPCRKMDLESLGTQPDIVLRLSERPGVVHSTTCIDIKISADTITEGMALNAIAKALNTSVNNLLLI